MEGERQEFHVPLGMSSLPYSEPPTDEVCSIQVVRPSGPQSKTKQKLHLVKTMKKATELCFDFSLSRGIHVIHTPLSI